MTETTFGIGGNVGIMLARGNLAIVATDANAADTGMIERAVRIQLKKMSGVMTLVAFGFGLNVKSGFSNGNRTVMAFAASTENLLVIDKGDAGKGLRGMAGLTRVRGGEMVATLAHDLALPRYQVDLPVMTLLALGGQANMIEWPG